MIKVICLTVETLTFLEFIWAALFYFRSARSPKIGVKVIKFFGTFFIAVDIYFLFKVTEISLVLFIFGLASFIVSNLLLWSALYANWHIPLDFAFASTPKHFIKKGPYRFMRHPFYTAYIAAWFGAWILSPAIVPALIAATMFVIYHKAAVKEEVDFLNTEYRGEYSQYMSETFRFLPWIVRQRNDSASKQKAA
jgi:protein-S-isoprenylcysteine O-methyltransferase Ste14